MDDRMAKDKLKVEKIIMHLAEIRNIIDMYELDSCEKMEDDSVIFNSIAMSIALVGKSIRGLSIKFKKLHSNIAWQYLATLSSSVPSKNIGDQLNSELIWKFAAIDAPTLYNCFCKIVEEMQ